MFTAVPETFRRIRNAATLNRTGESNKPIRDDNEVFLCGYKHTLSC